LNSSNHFPHPPLIEREKERKKEQDSK